MGHYFPSEPTRSLPSLCRESVSNNILRALVRSGRPQLYPSRCGLNRIHQTIRCTHTARPSGVAICIGESNFLGRLVYFSHWWPSRYSTTGPVGISPRPSQRYAAAIHDIGMNPATRANKAVTHEAERNHQYVKVFDITGKPMKNWILVKPEGVAEDVQLNGWIQRAVKFVVKLPAKGSPISWASSQSGIRNQGTCRGAG
jgi:hypothetical protein